MITLLTYLLLNFSPCVNAQSEVHIAINESHNINVVPGQKIRLRGKKFIHVSDHGSYLKIIGQKVGEAAVILPDRLIKIFVVEKTNSEFIIKLNAKIKSFMGLKTYLQNGEIVVSGRLLRLSDWQDITELAQSLNSRYVMAAKIDSDILTSANEWVDLRLSERGLARPHIVWAPRVQAFVSDDFKNMKNHWDLALSPLGIETIYEKSQLAIQPLVRVNIVVAEVNKKIQSQVGIEWPNMISAQLAPTLKGPTSLDVFLKAMELKGMGQILASPNLLARSGSEADFLAGGEFGIKLISSKTKEVVWKKHGIYLKIKPLADLTGRLSIELATEVSLIDAAQSIDGIPALKTNKMSTHFDLVEPRTIVLSGLIRNDWGRSHNGVAGLVDLPIIGALFKSKDFFNNKSELVIFVTPEIVNTRLTNETQLLPKSWGTHD